MRALPLLSAFGAVAMNALSPVIDLSPAACRSPQSHAAGAEAHEARPKDEVWLKDEDLRTLGLTTEEVALEQIDETLVAVGPIVSAAECPLRSPAEKSESCVIVSVEQSALERVRVDGLATARTANLVHDVFPGRVAWIAGTLDRSGRTVKLGCLFPDPMGELRPGGQVRVELVVGAKPAFVVSRGAVVQTRDEAFVFTSEGTTADGRHRFARIPIRPAEDTGGPWLPVTDLRPGSVVVRSGAEKLASILAVTNL